MNASSTMRAANWGLALLSLAMFLTLPCPAYGVSKPEPGKSLAIGHILSTIVAEGTAPGMIAAIASHEGLIAIGSAGLRKTGHAGIISSKDLVHLGSCTKAMTAVMLATLVSEGKLAWEMRLIDVIPRLRESIHPDYHTTTLWQLLTHRAGLPKNPTDWHAHGEKEIAERRLSILKDNLRHPAPSPPGEHHYSNFGYMIAASMAEQTTGMSWEVLIRARLFKPLGMSSAGFGAPDSAGKNDQPWGHGRYGDHWQPRDDYDAVSLGPAGEIHCTLEDWARFLAIFLAPDNPILDPKQVKKLIEPVGFYAGGWGVAKQPWAQGPMLTHSGTNGIWYASVVLAPILDRAFMVATNSCDFSSTPDLCTQVMNRLIKLELKNKEERPKVSCRESSR